MGLGGRLVELYWDLGLGGKLRVRLTSALVMRTATAIGMGIGTAIGMVTSGMGQCGTLDFGMRSWMGFGVRRWTADAVEIEDRRAEGGDTWIGGRGHVVQFRTEFDYDLTRLLTRSTKTSSASRRDVRDVRLLLD